MARDRTPEEAGVAASDLDAFAFEIYKTAVANHPVKRGGEHMARDAYQKAQAFLAVRDKVRSGALSPEKPRGLQLADCSAPNLRPTHPHNLVSQRFGDLLRVNRIKKWLDAHPTPEKEPEEVVQQLNREFPELSWDLAAVNTARVIFPAYAEKN